MFRNHIVRYSISENRVESIVKLNAPEYWESYISPSPDGETVMAIAVEFPDGCGETNEILIDYRQKTYAPKPEGFLFPEKENDPYLLYSVDIKEGSFYQLYNKGMEYKEIRAVSPEDGSISISGYTLIDENRMGVIIGHSYLGYDKFLIIDINQDIIIQECVLNEWDGDAAKYWEERFKDQ